MAPAAIHDFKENPDLLATPAPSITSDSSNNDGILPSNNAAQHLIAQALRQRIDGIDPNTCEAGGEEAFFVCDLGEIRRQHERWTLSLPRVEPHYGWCTS